MPIEIVGHRGSLARYPKNCLEAIGETFRLGYRALEVDLLLIISWVVNDSKRYRELAEWGVGGIITDDVLRFCQKK